ncbi:MAG: protein kinase [Candidatus Eremiobacteraeota bacterium]|nr:protein kinase [Candidatus Eremiobacteraeota bacterium]MCW5866968.1 protein kinase [Candidatus Eremiobacteraeota bacterium]
MQSAPDNVCGFKVLEELGQGAMGVVYLGLHENLGRKLAIKVMSKDYAHNQEFVERFKREGQIAAKLRHPYIVQIYDFAIHEGTPFIAMEYLGSRTLKSHMQELKRVPIAEAVRLTDQLLDGLEHAHAHGIIHRDIKPANVMVTDAGNAALTDFSISYLATANQLTQTGTTLGTPEYMAPEQLDGRHYENSDVYATAVMLYEMVTGISPFRAESLSQVMKKQLFEMPAPPDSLDFAIPEALSQVIMKALAKDTNDRYPNAKAMRAALREAMQAAPSPAPVVKASEIQPTVSPAEKVQEQPKVEVTVEADPPPPPVFSEAPQAPDWSGVEHLDSATMVGRNWDLKSITEDTQTGAPMKMLPFGEETLRSAPPPVTAAHPGPTSRPVPAPPAPPPPALEEPSGGSSKLPLAIGSGLLVGLVGLFAAFGRPQTPALASASPTPRPGESSPASTSPTPVLPPPPSEGKIQLKQLPAGAQVVVDDQTSPATVEAGMLQLPVGDHRLKVSAPDRKSKTLPVTVSATQVNEVVAQMEWAVGNVTLKVSPAGSVVEMDGKKVKPGALNGLTPGKHSFKASKTDYISAKKSFTVVAGRTLPLSLTLEPIPVPVQPDPVPFAPGPAPAPAPAPVPSIYR